MERFQNKTLQTEELSGRRERLISHFVHNRRQFKKAVACPKGFSCGLKPGEISMLICSNTYANCQWLAPIVLASTGTVLVKQTVQYMKLVEECLAHSKHS